MTPAPTVSVITISLNDLDGLKRTVDSVRAQRYTGLIEHIVIDGGSGEDVVDYLSGSEPAFTYWQSEPDGGINDAMNEGIAHASGDLLWFMHSSDRFSDPDVLAQVVEAISNHGTARHLWGYGMYKLIGPRSRRRPWSGPMPFNMCRFLAGYFIPHQAAFFGSSLVSELGGYRPEFGISADQEFMLRAALLRPPITIPRVVCDFDTSGISMTRQPSQHFRDFRRLCDVYGDYNPSGPRMLLICLRCYHRCMETYLSCLDCLNRQLRRAIGLYGVVDRERPMAGER